jgi:hypothetical protein
MQLEMAGSRMEPNLISPKKDGTSPNHEQETASSSTTRHLEILLKPPTKMKRALSTMGLIQSGDLRVVPVIAIDFSLANLTFEDNTCMHSTNPNKPNDYRDLLQMFTQSYANVLNLPIFGYGAKTSPLAAKNSPLFPLSRSIRNPFTPNQTVMLDQMYSDCLSMLELAVPVNLTPMLQFFKQIGEH